MEQFSKIPLLQVEGYISIISNNWKNSNILASLYKTFLNTCYTNKQYILEHACFFQTLYSIYRCIQLINHSNFTSAKQIPNV